MIVCSFALPSESGGFVGHLHHSWKVKGGALPWILGNLGRHEILVVHVGIGRDSAAEVVGEVLLHHAPWLWICSGFAGALDPTLEGGDIFIAENFSASDPFSRAAALEAPIHRVRTGRMVTSPHPLESPAAKRALAAQTGALAVDMETERILEECLHRDLPLLSVRAISDTASQSLPVPFDVWFDAGSQKPRPLALVRHLLAHPSQVTPFSGFLENVFLAKRNLATYLDAYLAAL
jgi:adenosylhomocysteine nucleosidase